MLFLFQPYEDKFYEDLKNITLQSFKLTSFNTDYHLPPDSGGIIGWNVWLKNVLQSEKKKSCFICVDNENKKAVGYILYGAEPNYSKIIEKKIGTIILLAVKEEYRSKHKICDELLKNVITLFNNNNFDIITVGTDLNNLPALINYIKFGFIPILFWSTYRNYFELKLIKNELYKVEEINNEESILIFLNNFKRPNSLLIDKKIDKKNELEEFLKEQVKYEIINQKLKLVGAYKKNELLAFCTFLYRKEISNLLKKSFVTINDLIFLTEKEEEKIFLLSSILNYFKNNGAEVVEIFLESDRFKEIKILNECGFYLIHNAVTLHKHLK